MISRSKILENGKVNVLNLDLVRARVDECVVSERYRLVKMFARRTVRAVTRSGHRDKPNIV